VIFTGRVSQADLEELMRSANALVYVPLFEGFGIPVLEAMKSAVPVIASNTSSLPEVCGHAALLVDPMKTEVIARAMELIERDGSLRADLLKKAEAQLSKFSWDSSAELLWQSAERTLRKQAE
jgi:glycosyltransferase involved in cell wall biosynthesis